MLDLVSAVVPIFLVVAVGYLCTRLGLFQRTDMAILARYVVKVALPLLVFVNVFGRPASEIFHPSYLLTYAGAALVMFALAAWWGRVARRGPLRATFLGLVMSGTNNGFIGFPIFLILMPQSAGAAVAMDMMVDSVLIIPLALFLAERSQHVTGAAAHRLWLTVRSVATQPMVIAITAALLLNAAGVGVPTMVSRGVSLLAQASSGTALFAVGGLLTGLRLGHLMGDLAVAVVGKLVVMPAVGLGLLLGLAALGLPDLPPPLRAAVLITCALPTFTVAPALAVRYGEGEFASAAMMIQIVLSFFTLTGWLFALQALGWL